jgi:hypothetical protein
MRRSRGLDAESPAVAAGRPLTKSESHRGEQEKQASKRLKLRCAVVRSFSWLREAERFSSHPTVLANACHVGHTSFTFALTVFGEFLFQAIEFSIQIAIVFEAIGPDNPLATTFAFLTAVTNIPVTYLTVIDGAHSIAGITGAFFVDAIIGIGASITAAIILAKLGSARTSMSPLIQPETAREKT